MRIHLASWKGAALLAAALVAAAVTAAVGSARPDVVDTTAKIAPKPLEGTKEALYRSSFRSTKGTMNKVTSNTTFPAGYSVLGIQTSPSGVLCTQSAGPLGEVIVTCSFGNAAQGVILSLSIKVTVADVPGPLPVEKSFPTLWQFKDMGGGQPGNSASTDEELVSDTAKVYPSGDASVSSDCLESSDTLSASLGEASISFTTPGPGALLCLPLGLQVSPPNPALCVTNRECKSEVLTSFAGATFTAGSPAQGTLVFTTFADKQAAVVFHDGVNPPKLVPLCEDVTLSPTNPACEVDRSFAGGNVTVFVRWLGNDPFWNM